jgi:hypothetical protein
MADRMAPLCGMDEALAAAEAAAFVGRRWKEKLPKPIRPVPRGSPPAISGRERAAELSSPGTGEVESERSEEPGEGRPGNALCQPTLTRSLARVGLSRPGRGGSLAEPRTLFEAEAKAALAEFGVIVPEGRVVQSSEQAVAAAEMLGYPVAVKALGLAHKSEAGAVRLNLAGAAEVRNAAEALAGLGTGLLVERMVTDPVAELLVGVSCDPQFGLLMSVAAGGVLVELLGDSASLLLPADADHMRNALLSLRLAPLLQGFRGRPIADLDAAIAAMLAVAEFAEAHADKLEELDVNPLLVRPQGQGAVAVDALIRLAGR